MKFSAPRTQAIWNGEKNRTSATPASRPPAAEPTHSYTYTTLVASAPETPASIARSRPAAANDAPETRQKRLKAPTETNKTAAGPKLSPGTASRAVFEARMAWMVRGNATAASASSVARESRGRLMQSVIRPKIALPAAVHSNQLASISPSEISFPPKTAISSRMSVICATAAVKPIRANAVRLPNLAPTTPGIRALSREVKTCR